jgi:hypothetical protein
MWENLPLVTEFLTGTGRHDAKNRNSACIFSALKYL